MKLRKKYVWWAVAIAGGTALVALMRRPTVVPVETVTVSSGPLTVTLDEEGRTRVRDRYVVVAPVSGALGRIEVEPGDSVTTNQIVARLQPAPLDARGREQADAVLQAAEANQRAAESAVQQARAELEQARRTGRRMAVLEREKALSAAELERAALAETTAAYALASTESRARAATHQVTQARAALLAAADPGASVAVRSPACGSVLAVPERSERIVAAGTPLLEVGDCSRLEVVIDLLTTDVVDVKPGQRVLVDPWSDERTPLEARVRRVEPAAFTKVSALGVEEQRVNVIADFVSPVPGLGDGFRVEARIVLWDASGVLQVPTSALFRQRDAWSLFVVEDGRARVRAVTLGRRNATAAEVLEGVAAGEMVIRHPSDRVIEGVRVKG